MRNTIKCLMLAAALTMVWGCSSSDDNVTGGECRGVGRPGTDFNVFHQQNGEQAQLRYYSKSRGGIYTVRQSLTLTAGIEIVEIEI